MSRNISRAIGPPKPATAQFLEEGGADDEPGPVDESASVLASTPKNDPPLNPDEIPPEEAPVIVDEVKRVDARTAAWASFCQALFNSAEFRYTK